MDRLHEIIGHLRDEEYDAVLYGVMLRFLNNKAKEYNCDVSELLLSIDKDKKTIDVLNYESASSMEVTLSEEIKVNEA